MPTSAAVEVTSRLPVTAASLYPPPPRSNLIKRVAAYLRERKIKKETKKLDARKKQRDLLTHPNQQLVHPSEQSLSAIGQISTTPKADLPLPSANPVSPTRPSVYVGICGSASSSDTSVTRNHTTADKTLIDCTHKQDDLEDDNFDWSLLALEAVQAFLSGYCNPIQSTIVVDPPKLTSFPDPASNPVTDVSASTLPTHDVTGEPAQTTKGARFLNRLSTWIEVARASHVREPTLDKRPRAGREFVMTWATILEE